MRSKIGEQTQGDYRLSTLGKHWAAMIRLGSLLVYQRQIERVELENTR